MEFLSIMGLAQALCILSLTVIIGSCLLPKVRVPSGNCGFSLLKHLFVLVQGFGCRSAASI